MRTMADIWDKVEKLYKVDGTGKMEAVQSITTGSRALDDALGIWGLPKGRIIQYAGKESSGKTLMSLVAIREWQKLDPKNWAMFIDAEFTYNKDWAIKLGVDNERVFLFKESDGVKIWTLLCGVPPKDNKSKGKPGLLQMEAEEPSGLGIIVLDSVAAVQAPIEAHKEVGNTNMAPMARFLPDALKRLTPLLAQTGVTFIAINQIRVDLGKMFGDPMSTPGGQAWKHACSTMVHFTMSTKKDLQFINEAGTRYGHVAMARIDKNKVAFPMSTCKFELEYNKGVVREHKEIIELGIKYGIIEKPNDKTYKYGEISWSGKEKCCSGILAAGLVEEIFEKVKEAKENGLGPGDKALVSDEDLNIEEVMGDNEEL